jgi:16S rRNA (guanine966-N2)-methyltransferase
LDLFAGSGALGFEALSRGAAEVTFVESAPPVVRVIRENAQDLKTGEAIRVLALPAERALRELAGSRFDLVFADPPYADGWEKTLLEWDWSTLLNEDALVCLEWSPLVCKAFADGALPESVGPLVKAREKAYGETVLSHFRYNTLGDATSGDAVS